MPQVEEAWVREARLEGKKPWKLKSGGGQRRGRSPRRTAEVIYIYIYCISLISYNSHHKS